MFALFSMWNRTPGLKLAGVPVAPALHLELERSSGSRESDMKQLRSVVDYVSLTVPDDSIRRTLKLLFKVFGDLCGISYITSDWECQSQDEIR